MEAYVKPATTTNYRTVDWRYHPRSARWYAKEHFSFLHCELACMTPFRTKEPFRHMAYYCHELADHRIVVITFMRDTCIVVYKT